MEWKDKTVKEVNVVVETVTTQVAVFYVNAHIVDDVLG